MNVPTKLIVHHTGGSDLNPLQDSSNFTFEQCDELHKNNPNVNLGHPSSLGYYIGYHYFIDKTGKTTQGRADTDEGAHTIGQNLSSIGICLAGNFDFSLPTDAQINSLKALLLKKMTEHAILRDNIYPHRHFANKTCYGTKLPDDWARNLITPVSPDSKETIKQQIKNLLDKL